MPLQDCDKKFQSLCVHYNTKYVNIWKRHSTTHPSLHYINLQRQGLQHILPCLQQPKIGEAKI